MSDVDLKKENERLKLVNQRLILALEAVLVATRAALDNAKAADGWEYCPRCEQIQPTIDEGATCASCHLVL